MIILLKIVRVSELLAISMEAERFNAKFQNFQLRQCLLSELNWFPSSRDVPEVQKAKNSVILRALDLDLQNFSFPIWFIQNQKLDSQILSKIAECFLKAEHSLSILQKGR